jgi:cysteinyl-tRNA synthetase
MGLFGRLFNSHKKELSAPRIYLHNTLTNAKELFVPLRPREATMYTCGPTVYSKQHIGNLRPPLVSDSLARVLTHAGFHVRRVTNITDVGHLVGDAEEGEDKMSIAALKEKKTPHDIAEHYAKLYIDDLHDLRIDTEHILFPRATAYIKEQIAFARTLEEKGFAYKIPDGLYFDSSKFPAYGVLGNRQGVDLKEGARVAKVEGKRHGSDFALWRAAKPNDLQVWDSPWGRGNPGWHLECSTMSRSLLGITIDIHTGGEDLASVHHNDEIAQSEAANGRPFVRYWIHNGFLNIQGEKISKSLHNEIYLSDVIEKGIHPLALRYFYLQAHYRTPLSFSWDALSGAAEALNRLWRYAEEVREESGGKASESPARTQFVSLMRDDLATPQALGHLWETLKSEEFTPQVKWGLLTDADQLLGLSLTAPPQVNAPIALESLPKEVATLVTNREKARKAKEYAESDLLRSQIEKSGYHVEDSPQGPVLTRRT